MRVTIIFRRLMERTFRRSSWKTSFTVSSAFLVAERTSPDIQLRSLSGNHTWVPLLYMFSAMAVVEQDVVPILNDSVQ